MKTPITVYGQFAMIATIAESVLVEKKDGAPPVLEPKEALECVASLAKVGASMALAASKEPAATEK